MHVDCLVKLALSKIDFNIEPSGEDDTISGHTTTINKLNIIFGPRDRKRTNDWLYVVYIIQYQHDIASAVML